MNRIHIVGSGPRTGTTLLAEAMKVCFNIDCSSEHEDSICVSNYKMGKGDIILSKYPREIELLKWPLKVNKKLHVICIVRDPRDMICSYHGAQKDIYYAGLNNWKLFLHYHVKLKQHKRFITVKYEDLVTSPDKIQLKIEKSIPGLVKVHPFSEYHIHAKPGEKSRDALNKIRPIEPAGIGNWKSHLPRIKQQLEVHGDISESLIKYGYEEDTEWVKELENTERKDYITYTGDDKRRKRKKGELLAVANFLIEKLGLNPDKILNPLKNGR